MGGREVTARLRADAEARPGERTQLAIDMSKAVLFDTETERRIA